jgi:hypothetical protein
VFDFGCRSCNDTAYDASAYAMSRARCWPLFSLLLTLAMCSACKRGPATRGLDASPPVIVSASSTSGLPSRIASAPSSRPLNAASLASPPWPAASVGTTLTLTWVVFPLAAGDKGALDTLDPGHRVELRVQVGKVERRVELPPMAGALFPDEQGVCRRSAGQPDAAPISPLAELTFSGSSRAGYLVEREGDGELAIVLFSAAAEHCNEAEACPRTTKRLGVMSVPNGLPTREALLLNEGPTRELAYRCHD